MSFHEVMVLFLSLLIGVLGDKAIIFVDFSLSETLYIGYQF